MRKILPLFVLFVFHFSISSAQDQDIDTISCRNGKKIVGKVIAIGKDKVIYIIPPDSTPIGVSTWRLDYIAYPGGTKFNFTERAKPAMASTSDLFLSADFGMSVPSISFRDAIAGLHLGPKATYYFNHHLGIVLKAQVDFNGTGFDYISPGSLGGVYIFQQYMAGLTYRTGGKPGFPFIDFIGLGGLCNAINPTYESGGGTSPFTITKPGSGTGAGYYFGIDFSSSADHFVSFTFGAGFLYSVFNYSNYVQTIYTYHPYTGLTDIATNNVDPKMGLVLYQMYVGINFRAKKAGR